MAVDAAGQHQQAGGIDDVIGVSQGPASVVATMRPSLIATSSDRNIALEDVARGGDRAVPDDGVESGHGGYFP
ncbi:hypothetical protein [Bradyrhizobium sp.]|uniref:hypothetical protein n=1 Tax=Bradyrhizobium sp. TaxID=376 RepID=UPI003C5EF1BB